MKKIAMTAIAASLALAAPAFADDAHHPGKAAAAKPAPAAALRTMQDNVKKMQAQLGRAAKAKTDEERQKAMAEHMQTMQENMHMAHDMQGDAMGCAMMEGGAKGKGMMGGGMGMMPGPMGGGAPDRMQQMEKRMDMMQTMMEQMMRRPEGAPPAPMPTK